MMERLKSIIPDFEAFLACLSTPPPTAIRYNPEKRTKVADLPYHGEPIPWESQGIYLAQRPSFGDDPLWYAGLYYVQEPSSMSIGYVVRQLPLPEKAIVLDFSAAPGGKTTLLLSSLPNATIVANEPNPQRNKVLQENLLRWGYSNYVVTQADPNRWRLSGAFDLILVDAPCSGMGLWRKHPKYQQNWSFKHIKRFVKLQRHILNKVIALLKPNGFLIYSTCTYTQEENEEQIRWLLTQDSWQGVAIEVPETWGWLPVTIASGIQGWRLYPHKTRGEGFFLCTLQKKTKQQTMTFPNKKVSKIQHPLIRQALKPWNDKLIWCDENTYWIGKTLENHGIAVRQIGIPVVQIGKQKSFLFNAAALAVKELLKCPVVALSYEQAMAFLKGNLSVIPITLFAEEGYWQVKYKGLSLGVIRRLSKRLTKTR